ncbi:MAG TPA: MFS transporter [Candidatus Limnocylindrales bacterium]|nr:MFS transporter [Candidatus Limnocylindrales bacterium]
MVREVDRPIASLLLLGVASGAVLTPLNTTMLAVGLPSIMTEFGLTAGEVSSLVTLYLGTVAVALPVGGSLSDRFGHHRVFVVGVLAFAAASLLAAAATAFTMLEAARVLQAMSGALVSTSSVALIREAAPRDRTGEAFGVFDLLVSMSAAAGPFIGGVLVAAFGWRSVFTLAVPLALTAAVVVGLMRSGFPPPAGDAATGGRSARPIDAIGLALLGLAIACLVTVVRTGLAGVGLLALVAVAPLGVAFVRYELGRAEPAVDPRLFRMPGFAGATVGIFGSTIVLHGTFLLVPLLVERAIGGSAVESGVVLLGIAGVSAVVAPFGGRASDRFGRRSLVVGGSLLLALGVGGLALPAALTSLVAVGVLLSVIGLGFGLAGAPRQAAAFDGIAADRAGMAAGTYFTSRYLGGVVGAALGGAVLAGSTALGSFALGFGLMAVVAIAVAVASLALPAGAPRTGRIALR